MSNTILELCREKACLCIGLDSDVARVPKRFQKREDGQFDFNRWIIDQTAEFADGYKPNIAFYESEGPYGLWQLKQTVDYIKKRYPHKAVLLDCKRGDIDSTNIGYVRLAYEYLEVDAVTLNPYLGGEALAPFLAHGDKFHFMLCKTSNSGSGEFQDLSVDGGTERGSLPLWQVVAERIAGRWNAHNNCGLVVGATYPSQLRQVRQLVGETPILVPGVGTQGGTVREVLRHGLNSAGGGIIINVSRSVIFADDPGKEARQFAKSMGRS